MKRSEILEPAVLLKGWQSKNKGGEKDEERKSTKDHPAAKITLACGCPEHKTRYEAC